MIPQIKDTFYDTEIYVPKNYELYLEFMYGKNWRIHNPTYKNSDEHIKNAKNFRRYYKEK